jgi:hypothetical protein
MKDLEKQISQLEAEFKTLTTEKAFDDIEMNEPIEQIEPTNEQNEGTPQDNFADFVSYLKSAFEQSIVWHHQTTSYSMHKALNNFYDEVLELIDGLVESTSGIYGRPTDYVVAPPMNYESPEQVTAYFQACYAEIQEDRKDIYQETWIQNQVDEIAQLFAETIYLLSLNK